MPSRGRRGRARRRARARLRGSGLALHVRVVAGFGSYVCGEETALIAALEGAAARCALRPPYPDRARPLRPPDGREQRRDARERALDRRARAATRSRRSARERSRGTKALCLNAGFARPGHRRGAVRPVAARRDRGLGRDRRATPSELAGVLLGGPDGELPRAGRVRRRDLLRRAGASAASRSATAGSWRCRAAPTSRRSRATCSAFMARRVLRALRALPRRLGARATRSRTAGPRARTRRDRAPLLDADARREPVRLRPRARPARCARCSRASLRGRRARERAASIDGRAVAPAAGESVLAAATRLGIQIPRSAALAGLPPEGGCRLCVVEVAGAREPLAACHTAARARHAASRTRTPRLRALRRELLALLVDERAPALRADPHGSEVERLMHELGVRRRAARAPTPDREPPAAALRRRRAASRAGAASTCAPTSRARSSGTSTAAAARRSSTSARERFAESACVACGACVDVCPSGAITDRDRAERAGARARARAAPAATAASAARSRSARPAAAWCASTACATRP